MANTLTNVTATMVQDEVLPALKLGLLPLNAFSVSVDTSGTKGVGDAIRVPIASGRSAATYSGSWETGDTTVATKSVTLAAPTFAAWYVDPYQEGMPTIERFLASGRECAYGVAKSVMQNVLAFFVDANIGNTDTTDEITVTAANYDVDDQATLWGMLKAKGVTGPVSAIHTLDYATALLKDNALQDRSASGSDVLQTGELPPILGARQFYTDAFPTAVTNQNTQVIYTGKQSAGIGFAMPNPDILAGEEEAGVVIRTVQDPETGIPLVWRTWTNTATGFYWGAVYTMHGQAFLQDAAVKIVSA